MSEARSKRSVVTATAQEVLPKFGLAYLIDDQETTWTVTGSTQGPGLDTLHTGQRIQLRLDHHPGFSVVRSYERLT
jgi:hypothetical protein